MPDLELASHEQKEQAQGSEASTQITEDHSPASRPSIYNRAGQGRQDNAGQHSTQADERKVSSRAGLLEGPNAERKAGDSGTHE